MSHRKEKSDDVFPTIHSHDYLDVKPVEIIWEYEEKLIEAYSTASSAIIEEKDTNEMDHLHCVYPHFNDEVYRYCLLIKTQKSDSQCWPASGHRMVCCCFVKNDEETCMPLTSPATTSTTPRTTTAKNKPSARRKITGPPIRKKKCQSSECDQIPIPSKAVKYSGKYLFVSIVLFPTFFLDNHRQ